MKIKIEEYKTHKINKYTGGVIKDYSPVDGEGRCFTTTDGIYIGNYALGWRYYKKGYIVDTDYPSLGAFILKERAAKISNFKRKLKENDLESDFSGYLLNTEGTSYVFNIGRNIYDPTNVSVGIEIRDIKHAKELAMAFLERKAVVFSSL